MAYNPDIQHALISFASTFSPYDEQPLKSIREFSNGMVFAHLLTTVERFPLALKDLQSTSQKWIQRLTNLKIILQRMEAYIKESGKTLLTKDIDLIEIAKHQSSTHILRFFELVVAVFMQSQHKEGYIQTIMHLDQRSQHALVVIVQNAIGERTTDGTQNSIDSKIIQQLQELTNQNQLLREEIKELAVSSGKYKRELMEARERMEELQELEEKYRQSRTETFANNEIQQMKIMNDNLKQKLLQSVREHEQEISRVREENIFLQNKMKQFKEYEEAIQQLKEQLTDSQGDRQRLSELEREKRRLSRLIEDKEATIRQLKERLDETSQKNHSMQESQFYMKVELEKKEVRFQQLQKEVKSRLKAEPLTTNTNPVNLNEKQDNQELDYLHQEIQKMRAVHRQLERENSKLKKKMQKSASIQAEKKKLQKIVVDVSKTKDAEIEMLVVSLYDLRCENIRMHELLTKQ